MNKFQFKGEWHDLKGKLSQSCAELTDNEDDDGEGQKGELLGHLQKGLGTSQQAIIGLMNRP
jgi:uncharacterized protein YjbJ (UPF0337 family)